jgi:two-component system sensor histidine kinase KdpD
VPNEPRDELVAPAGAFRIYLGAVAGVGKTCAMLDEGRRRSARGTDVVIGLVESHGRSHTAELAEGLEVVPRRSVQYRGATFSEMDLDAILSRRPAVVLVDELAHTNVPGSGRHEKRYEDVFELLDRGISVISTVNIQHLESLADAVETMTGVPVRERLPDHVLQRADQIELVDSSAEQLRRRMLHGHIYPADRVSDALTHFFRTENLVALRELALRYVADESEEELHAFLEARHPAELWETTERILVGVSASSEAAAALRRAARIAARSKGELHAVSVHDADRERPQDAELLSTLRKLALDLGASWHELAGEDPATALVNFAREHQITQIVLGTSRRGRLAHLSRRSVVGRVLRAAGAAGVDVHIIARAVAADRAPHPPVQARRHGTESPE